ncbi:MULTISPECIES: acyl carrier protein [Pseudomonas]|uniref:Acyl carrier protein n=1 Tax=Pseudomonas piscis TaxID=2614538 RepID=U7A422_9PSED|nr:MULTISPECIES: acyl carrier protein [Pseudomonas]AZC20111.1 hypothetical protein C4K40_4744 [Pseudomonas sp. CMR5c]ERO64359.1 hypothetical protein P308_24155 [Pseudomonas piscis]MCU7650348.1 acyl carrier protein [Pseudomonas piscis]MQA55591.1 acyl carrier protein [Pseudomonas piscis]POA50866.1 acyl carrier protein [Pseudomonas sp. FW507-12TSA]
MTQLNATLVANKIKEIIAERLDLDIPVSGINEAAGLASEVGVDSIGFIELKFQCEEEFQIQIAEEEFVPEHFFSVHTLSSLVLEKSGALQA